MQVVQPERMERVPERLAVVKVAVACGRHDDLMLLLGSTHPTNDALHQLSVSNL